MLGVTSLLGQSLLLSLVFYEHFHSYKLKASSANGHFACVYRVAGMKRYFMVLEVNAISFMNSSWNDRESNPQSGKAGYSSLNSCGCMGPCNKIDKICK